MPNNEATTKYSADKDVELYDLGDFVIDQKSDVRIKGTINSYDGGEPKLVLKKAGKKWDSPNLGRLSESTLQPLMKMMNDATRAMISKPWEK